MSDGSLLNKLFYRYCEGWFSYKISFLKTLLDEKEIRRAFEKFDEALYRAKK